MTNITLAIPEDIKKEMEKFPEINWSAIAREAIKRRILMLKKFREFAKDSELTEDEAVSLGKELNKSLRKRNKE